jgi:hypothetical protein
MANHNKRQELLQSSEWLTKPPRIDTGKAVLPWNTSRLLHPAWSIWCGTAFPIQLMIITSQAHPTIPRFR